MTRPQSSSGRVHWTAGRSASISTYTPRAAERHIRMTAVSSARVSFRLKAEATRNKGVSFRLKAEATGDELEAEARGDELKAEAAGLVSLVASAFRRKKLPSEIAQTT